MLTRRRLIAAIIVCTALFLTSSRIAQSAEKRPRGWEPGPTGTQVSLRGLDALNEKIIWASGAAGTVIRSADGGSSWTNCSPPGYSEVEFRCVVALDETTAMIASAGTPAVLLRTTDAGATWKKVYSHGSPNAFFDSMKFWDTEYGIAMSDPVDGRLLIVVTSDGGQSWREVPHDDLPECRESEAAFAASNSSITLGRGGQVWIGMGGTNSPNSRIYYRSSWDAKFTALICPLKSSETEGVFALTTAVDPSGDDAAGHRLIAVGGDYRDNKREDLENSERTQPSSTPPTAFYSDDEGNSWLAASVAPANFRSAVIELPARAGLATGFITTGPTGSDYSIDGSSWEPIEGLGFHALAVGGETVFACGSNGRFAMLIWE